MADTARIAVLDLGSISLRLDIFDVSERGQNQVVRQRALLWLGRLISEGGELSGDAWISVFNEFERISVTLNKLKPDYFVGVATSAFRESPLGERFLSELLKRYGLSIRVISGEEEARLTARGILANEKLSQKVVCADVGGGSTEFSFCEDGEVKNVYSCKCGAESLHRGFFADLRVSEYRLAREYAESSINKELAVVREKAKTFKEFDLVASSGTARALGRILSPDGSEGGAFNIENLDKLVDNLMLSKSWQDLLKLPGVEPSRVEVIVPGAVIFRQIMHALGVKTASVTKFSLRHGMLEEAKEALARK